jgi:hypothetical protein
MFAEIVNHLQCVQCGAEKCLVARLLLAARRGLGDFVAGLRFRRDDKFFILRELPGLHGLAIDHRMSSDGNRALLGRTLRSDREPLFPQFAAMTSDRSPREVQHDANCAVRVAVENQLLDRPAFAFAPFRLTCGNKFDFTHAYVS